MTDKAISHNLRCARWSATLSKSFIQDGDAFHSAWCARHSVNLLNTIINSINWED